MEIVTPVPKKTTKLEKLTDMRKMVSTSDFSKIFEKYFKEWIMEDIYNNLSSSQYGGKKGTAGTEHGTVNFVDRILQMLDQNDKYAVIVSYDNWRGAFDRQDPTIMIKKFIELGVRSSLVLQGILIGQLLYCGSSDDAASEIPQEDKFKLLGVWVSEDLSWSRKVK